MARFSGERTPLSVCCIAQSFIFNVQKLVKSKEIDMKVFSVIKHTFSIVGIALLLGALFSYKNASDFLKDVVSATGTVVDFERKRGADSITYSPVVRFLSREGQTIEFTSSVGSSRPAYSVKDRVEVLYSSLNVQKVKINSFFELWGAFLIMLVMGGAFLFIGVLIFLVARLRNRKKEYLQRHGMAVEDEIQSVDLNLGISMNGKNPFVIVCHWLNPETSKIHEFKSENIWFDPSRYIANDTVKVLLERCNPSKYHVDISFLPMLKS